MVEDRTGRRYLLSALRNSLLITVPVVGVIGLVVFALMSRRLSYLTRVVTSFGRGRYGERTSISSRDELGALGASFNLMADTIEANIQALKRADRLRRDLVANVSHDLRNPLASIQGYAETLVMKEESLAPNERREYVRTILDSTQILNRLVEELFELSKLESREARPSRTVFPVDDLMEEVYARMKPRAEKRGTVFTADIPERNCRVAADRSMIERVLMNLVDNALKFTQSGGSAAVALRRLDNAIRVSVIDSGPGLSAEDLPAIFDRFYKGDASRAGAKSGSGLGLAISKRIAELHGSSIQATSRKGAGSTFSFDLPAVE